MATEGVCSSHVPIVALGELGVQHPGEPSQQEWQRVTRRLEEVLSKTGYAYLTDHGLPQHLVNDVVSSGAAFFQLGMEDKMKWSPGEGLTGYLKEGDEKYSNAIESKESFLFQPGNYNLLNKEPPPFEETVTPMFDLVQALSTRLMAGISLSLGKPRDYLVKMHVDAAKESHYRFNYYPESAKGRKNVVVFGAHRDFITFSLIFSNGTGGLQVCPAGQWVDLPVVPGALVLIVGEFLSFHSNKRLKAAMHRVVLPSDEQQESSPRCSLVFFLHADAHLPMWPPSDDPTSPPPPSLGEYLAEKVIKARTPRFKY